MQFVYWYGISDMDAQTIRSFEANSLEEAMSQVFRGLLDDRRSAGVVRMVQVDRYINLTNHLSYVRTVRDLRRQHEEQLNVLQATAMSLVSAEDHLARLDPPLNKDYVFASDKEDDSEAEVA